MEDDRDPSAGHDSEKESIKAVVQEVISSCEVEPCSQDLALRTTPIFTLQEERRLWRKVDMRLMPIMTIMYLCSFVDRGNIGTSQQTHCVPGDGR